MPVDMKRYPPDWRTTSLAVKARAGNACEWCGVPNGALIRRDTTNPAMYTLVDEAASVYSDVDGYRPVRVVLTVHHLGIDRDDGTPGDRHDKLDCRPENLVALCQRCHLLADLDMHMANAAETRRRKRVAAGQLELLTS